MIDFQIPAQKSGFYWDRRGPSLSSLPCTYTSSMETDSDGWRQENLSSWRELSTCTIYFKSYRTRAFSQWLVTGKHSSWLRYQELFLIAEQACYYPQRQENYQFFCIPQPRNDFSDVGTKILNISYFFYLLKFIDLLDTIFFILRKKNNQVSFLHIYHHAGIVVAGYLYCKLYSGGGYATVLCTVKRY